MAQELRLPKREEKQLPYIFQRLYEDHPTPGQQYRESTLGRTLQESIDELIAAGKLTEKLGKRIMLHFDVHTAGSLKRCGMQVNFTAEGKVPFKEVDGAYHFALKQMEASATSTHGPYSYFVSADSVLVKAVPSTKLIKKTLLKQRNQEAKIPVKKEENPTGLKLELE